MTHTSYTVTLSGTTYQCQWFTASESWTVPSGVVSVDVLVVAGGGSGGAGTQGGGGGGAGGLLWLTGQAVTPGASVSVVVGAGGAAKAASGGNGNNGSNSSFDASVATGGGGGGAGGVTGNNGGSGGGGPGGAAGANVAAGTGTSGQGSAGGVGQASNTNDFRIGGGGGGKAGAGGAANATASGAGGLAYDATALVGTTPGAAGWFAGGGSGGTRGVAASVSATTGGGGRGADGNPGTGHNPGSAGTAGTGGGGGGAGGNATPTVGYAGGDGVVIVRYVLPASAPNVPTTLSYTPTTTTLDFAWVAPASGAAPTGYEVRIDGGTALWVGTSLSHMFTGLGVGTPHTLEVRAANAAGASSWVSLSASTTEPPPAGPVSAYEAKVRIGSHTWDIEVGDVPDPDVPEVLAGATFSWTAPDNVGWPPPMWAVPRDVMQLKVRVPEAEDVADVRRGDVVRFKFTPLGYDYDAPLLDFAGVITGDPVMVDDPSGGVFLSVTASDYRVLLANFTVIGETVIGEGGVDTIGDALQFLSYAIDVLADGQFPGAFGDVTVGAVDPRGFLGGTMAEDVIVGVDDKASALYLFGLLGMVPVPQYDDDGDLDPVQPFRIVEPDPYGSDFATPDPLTAALIPNVSWQWRRDFIPTAVEGFGISGYLWSGGVTGDPLTATVLRLSTLAGFNQWGFGNELAETEPWSPASFMVRAWEDPEAVRDWLNYPDRVRQYVTIEDIATAKAPSGTDTVSGMVKEASLVVGPQGRFAVYAGLRPHSFNVI